MSDANHRALRRALAQGHRGAKRLREAAGAVRRRVSSLGRPPYVADEFTQRLMVSVAGMVLPGNMALFDRAIREMPAGAVVELGVFCGQSTLLLDHLLRVHNRDAPLYCADIWTYEGTRDEANFSDPSMRQRYLQSVAGRDDLARTAYTTWIRQRFIDNCRFFAAERLPAAFELTTDDFFAAWCAQEQREDVFGQRHQLGGEIAFCYVDGDHSYEQARRDVENAARHMRPGAMLLMDDSYEGCGMGSYEVARELLGDDRFEHLDAAPNHLFRAR